MARRKYHLPKANEWIYPVRTNYKLACCDCGLVHEIDFDLERNFKGPGKVIKFRVRRDNRLTAGMRKRKDADHPCVKPKNKKTRKR